MSWQSASRRRLVAGVAAGVCMLAGASGTAFGQCEAQKLLASSGAANDLFGFGLSVCGDVAVVRLPQMVYPSPQPGTAIIYRHGATGWTEEAWLEVPSADTLGFSAAIDGDTAIVGAIEFFTAGNGRAYVFRFDGASWALEATLADPDGSELDGFGLAVALKGNLAVVSAPNDDDNGNNSGSVFVYEHDGAAWIERQKLHPADPAGEQRFGSAVAIEGETIIVGADGDGENGQHAGCVYVFGYDGSVWVEQAKLLASDGVSDDMLGYSVAIDGDVVVAVAIEDSPSGAGKAYVYRFDGQSWIEEAKLVSSDGAPEDEFGISVSIDADRIAVGAQGADHSGDDSGAVYLFHFDGASWVEQAELLGSDGAAGDHFGRTVALDGEALFVGAPTANDLGESSGAAYVFDFAGEDCNDNGVCDPVDILNGTSWDLNNNGIPDECDGFCGGDINGDGTVDTADLLVLLGAWGPCPPRGGCPGDINGDGTVNVRDLLILLAQWGPCP